MCHICEKIPSEINFFETDLATDFVEIGQENYSWGTETFYVCKHCEDHFRCREDLSYHYPHWYFDKIEP